MPRDSENQTLEDLDGLKWGYGESGFTSNYMVPLVMIQDAGVTPSESVQTGGHPQAALAVYRGDVDFATIFYSVPLKPDGSPAWTYDQYVAGEVTEYMWDIPADVVDTCAPDAEGKKLLCSDWRVLDARANARTDVSDIVQKVRILLTSPAIPNDRLSFGPDFPADLRAQIEEAMLAFSETEAWGTSIGSQDFYGWTGIMPAEYSEYDMVRRWLKQPA